MNPYHNDTRPLPGSIISVFDDQYHMDTMALLTQANERIEELEEENRILRMHLNGGSIG